MSNMIKNIFTNIMRLLICICLFVLCLILIDKFKINHYKIQVVKNDLIASEYRIMSEAYNLDVARIKFENITKIYGRESDDNKK